MSTQIWPIPTWRVAGLFVADMLDRMYLVGSDKQCGVSGISGVWWPLDQYWVHHTSSS